MKKKKLMGRVSLVERGAEKYSTFWGSRWWPTWRTYLCNIHSVNGARRTTIMKEVPRDEKNFVRSKRRASLKAKKI